MSTTQLTARQNAPSTTSKTIDTSKQRPEQDQLLINIADQLNQLKVHEVGKISNIIEEMGKEDVKSPWKTGLVSDMHQRNQDRFDELVKMLK